MMAAIYLFIYLKKYLTKCFILKPGGAGEVGSRLGMFLDRHPQFIIIIIC